MAFAMAAAVVPVCLISPGHSLHTRSLQKSDTLHHSHASLSPSFKNLSLNLSQKGLIAPKAVAEVEPETVVESIETISSLSLQSDADIALNAVADARKERLALKKKLKKRQMWPPSKAAVNPQSRKYKIRAAKKKSAAKAAASKDGSEE